MGFKNRNKGNILSLLLAVLKDKGINVTEADLENKKRTIKNEQRNKKVLE